MKAKKVIKLVGMRRSRLLGSVGALFLVLQPVLSVEWNGGEDWALFDVAERRAMWVWDMGKDDAGTRKWDGAWGYVRGVENYKGARDLCLDFCENKSIRSIYVFNVTWEWNQEDINAGRIPNEAAWADLMADATDRGIQVWLMGYLWDDPDDARMGTAANKESIKKIMQVIHAFNLAHSATPIAGFSFDQEPGTVAVYADLLDTLKIAQDWVDANDPKLMISLALRPVWRNQQLEWNGLTNSMNEHVIRTIGHAAYMAYSDTPNTVLNIYARPACDYAATNGHRVAVGLEVADIAGLYTNADKDTWFEEIQAEPVSTRFKTDLAEPTTFEDCLHATAAELQSSTGYDRIVLHSYADYFMHWFGRRPRDYILSCSGETYESAATNPPAVDMGNDARLLVGLGPGSNYAAWASGQELSGSASMKSADPDDDALINFLEYAFALNPLTNDAPGSAVFHIDAEEAVHYAVRNLRDDLFYEVSVSTNLLEWVPHTAFVGQTGGTETNVTLFPELADGANRLFVRTQVSE
jgi:hypothetical protein